MTMNNRQILKTTTPEEHEMIAMVLERARYKKMSGGDHNPYLTSQEGAI